jgi:hypothetical protein
VPTAAAAGGAGPIVSLCTAGAAEAEGPGNRGVWPLYIQLSTGEELGVDLLVQAIGVEPATAWLPGVQQRLLRQQLHCIAVLICEKQCITSREVLLDSCS